MNQKLLLELNNDLQKQSDPFCCLEEVAELYHLTCLLDENIPDLEVPEGSTPSAIEALLSGYLKDRNIERCESPDEVVIYPDLELGSADLEFLECIDNQRAFELLVALVSIYSFASMNTIGFTQYVRDWREDDMCEDDEAEQEIGRIILKSTNEILETKTAQAVLKYEQIPLSDQIGSLRTELSLRKNDIPAFLATYISDALDTFEKCTSERFNLLAGYDDYHEESHSPLYYNVFFLYPENIHSHEHLIAEIDNAINCDLENHSGAIEVSRERYKHIQFFIDAVNEYKEVVNNLNDIIKAL